MASSDWALPNWLWHISIFAKATLNIWPKCGWTNLKLVRTHFESSWTPIFHRGIFPDFEIFPYLKYFWFLTILFRFFHTWDISDLWQFFRDISIFEIFLISGTRGRPGPMPDRRTILSWEEIFFVKQRIETGLKITFREKLFKCFLHFPMSTVVTIRVAKRPIHCGSDKIAGREMRPTWLELEIKANLTRIGNQGQLD